MVEPAAPIAVGDEGAIGGRAFRVLGRMQLDHGRGTLDVLPEVLEAVRGRAKVIIDGGFMRGTDVVKAIALGADLVGIGRLYGLGMSAAARHRGSPGGSSPHAGTSPGRGPTRLASTGCRPARFRRSS